MMTTETLTDPILAHYDAWRAAIDEVNRPDCDGEALSRAVTRQWTAWEVAMTCTPTTARGMACLAELVRDALQMDLVPEDDERRIAVDALVNAALANMETR